MHNRDFESETENPIRGWIQTLKDATGKSLNTIETVPCDLRQGSGMITGCFTIDTSDIEDPNAKCLLSLIERSDLND